LSSFKILSKNEIESSMWWLLPFTEEWCHTYTGEEQKEQRPFTRKNITKMHAMEKKFRNSYIV
jgi:hypothetical protein